MVTITFHYKVIIRGESCGGCESDPDDIKEIDINKKGYGCYIFNRQLPDDWREVVRRQIYNAELWQNYHTNIDQKDVFLFDIRRRSETDLPDDKGSWDFHYEETVKTQSKLVLKKDTTIPSKPRSFTVRKEWRPVQ